MIPGGLDVVAEAPVEEPELVWVSLEVGLVGCTIDVGKPVVEPTGLSHLEMSLPRLVKPPTMPPSPDETVVVFASVVSLVTVPASTVVGLALAPTVPAAVLVEASPVVVEVLPSAPT